MIAIKRAASERLRRTGVSMAQLNILYILHRSGEMTMSQLAECLNVSLSNATGLIDRMEERGFIERSRVPDGPARRRGAYDRRPARNSSMNTTP